jgi:hypothetical protein
MISLSVVRRLLHGVAGIRAWLETVAIAALMAGVLLMTRDRQAGVVLAPWLAVVPTAVALKHGLLPAACVLLAWACAHPSDLDGLLPTLALTAIAGLFRDHWHRTLTDLRAQRHEQEAQLKLLFRRHELLRASHADLEQHLAARAWSLDATLREATRVLAQASFQDAASVLLDVLVARASVGAASFFVARGGRLASKPSASVGPAPSCSGSEPVLLCAFEQGTSMVADFSALRRRGGGHTPVLAALPVVTAGGQTLGVVAVHELPFDKFNDEHLGVLTTLVLELADPLAARLAEERARKQPEPSAMRASRPAPSHLVQSP